ncbi:hypothetical protein [Quadrisphaera sp. INWT6]|uniref:hypothetical protein n=1 Tax=Quadrisphaera sp. INWT6 TaxID=2596917 RepID=UPI0018920DE5|nr:hypothetical protein [Quadrisphaera sp. INWT6]
MSVPEDQGVRDAAPGADPLARAAEALRLHTDAGWVRVRQRVVDAALSAVRPARTVAAQHELGRFSVSTDVLTDVVRTALEPLPDAAPSRVVFETDDDDRLVAVRTTVVVAFGADVVEAAEQVRQEVGGVLRAVLGEVAPASGGFVVDVHVGDVTVDRRTL